MIKILKYSIIFFLLISCSYEPILLNKKFDFEFIDIKYAGEKNINKIIKSNLIRQSSGVKKYKLNYSTKKFREILSSDTKGDPSIYKLNVNVKYELKENELIVLKNEISRQSIYNNINDKFELSKLEESILKNLSKNISDEILISISSIEK